MCDQCRFDADELHFERSVKLVKRTSYTIFIIYHVLNPKTTTSKQCQFDSEKQRFTDIRLRLKGWMGAV